MCIMLSPKVPISCGSPAFMYTASPGGTTVKGGDFVQFPLESANGMIALIECC